LFSEGDQVPAILLVEVVGKAVKVVPEHIGPIGLNVGTVLLGFTITVKVVLVAQSPAVGVNL